VPPYLTVSSNAWSGSATANIIRYCNNLRDCNGARPLHARKIGKVQGYFLGGKAPEKKGSEMPPCYAQREKCLRASAENMQNA